jgi:hypothetical protein
MEQHGNTTVPDSDRVICSNGEQLWFFLEENFFLFIYDAIGKIIAEKNF